MTEKVGSKVLIEREKNGGDLAVHFYSYKKKQLFKIKKTDELLNIFNNFFGVKRPLSPRLYESSNLYFCENNKQQKILKRGLKKQNKRGDLNFGKIELKFKGNVGMLNKRIATTIIRTINVFK